MKRELKMFMMLSDNADLNGLYLKDMEEVRQHIESDLEGIDIENRGNVQYVIQPVFMTEEDFNNLPEWNC